MSHNIPGPVLARWQGIEQRRRELTFKFAPGFLPEEFRLWLIRGLKAALNGKRRGVAYRYGISTRRGETSFMCVYLATQGSSERQSINSAFSWYSRNIWGVKLADTGTTAELGLLKALGLSWMYVSAEDTLQLRRLYYKQMVTDLLKEQRAYKRLKRFVALYEEALESHTYNEAVEGGNAYLCYSVDLNGGRGFFEKQINRLMEHSGFATSAINRGLGLVHRMARKHGWGYDANDNARAEGVNFSYNARLWHQDRLQELKAVLNGSHV